MQVIDSVNRLAYDVCVLFLTETQMALKWCADTGTAKQFYQPTKIKILRKKEKNADNSSEKFCSC